MTTNGRKPEPLPDVLEPNKLYCTDDYSAFVSAPGQRPIKWRSVEIIAESMRERGFIPGMHMLVTTKREIIEGQHRLKAAELLGISVWCMCEESLSRDNVPMLAKMAREWSPDDYLSAHASAGKKEYIKLKAFREKWGIAPSLCVAMAAKPGDRGAMQRDFQNGTLVFSNYEKAELIVQRCSDFGRWIVWWRDTVFVRAVQKVSEHPEYDHRQMMQRMEYNSIKLVRCVAVDQYIKILEEIYNYRSRAHIVNFLDKKS